jgi:3-hydroxyanthranilate 3,4-dioxygenase
MSIATIASPINFNRWVEENRHLLKPPVGNKCIWENEDFIVMVVGGPNKRKDYHVNETSEFFYQIQGDITVGIIDPQTKKPRNVVIREGETFLLPPLVPHSPRRPANTIGIVVEMKRPREKDRLRWYCDNCGELVYEAEFKLDNIAVDLKRIMDDFWANENLRRCKKDGSVIAPPTEAQPPPK